MYVSSSWFTDHWILKDFKRKVKKQLKHLERITGVQQNYKKKVRFNDKPQLILPNNMEYKIDEAVILANIAINLVQSYTLKQGIKKFGDDARHAAFKEVKQLHDRSSFKPIHFSLLTELERKRIFEIFNIHHRETRWNQEGQGSCQQ